MLKSFMGIFKKNKSDDKDKCQIDAAPEPEKDEVDEKKMDDLLKDNQYIINKNSPFYLFLENEDDRKIPCEYVQQEINKFITLPLTEAFFLLLKSWDYSKRKDDFRARYAAKNGGIEVTKMIRSTGVDIIKQIGKKIISGDFNLTTISFPIKCMLPLTILQTIAKSYFQFPIYVNLASIQNDPLERFKLVVVATLSSFHKSSHFIKPMNPILGETYDMLFSDGTKIYLEQTSHHPPISHFFMIGPKKNYKYYGFGNFSAGAGFNSVKIYNKGKRTVEFEDGHKIVFNFCNEAYNNSFFGTIKQESIGELNFKDIRYGFDLNIKLGNVKKKPSDYFQGEIKLKNIVVSKIYGTYCGYIEFNNIRYWDIRDNIETIESETQLPSSSIYREDRIFIEKNNVEAGQKSKESLEELQRHDKKLRHNNEKNKK